MKLFDNKIRRTLRYAKYSESHYEFMNISAKPEFVAMREKFEEWFSFYPNEEQNEFVVRFRNNNNEQFAAVFFELLMHEILRKLNYKIIIHPHICNNEKHPDFLITNTFNEEFFLELTTCTNQTKEEIGRKKLFNTILDIINEIRTTNFFIGVEIDRFPNKPIPASNIRNFLQKKLDELNPDHCIDIINNFGWDALPTWNFNYDNFEINFEPIPKDLRYRERITSKPIGHILPPQSYRDATIMIIKSLKNKAKKFGNLEKPYIIALNVFDIFIDKDVVINSLFGSIQNNCISNNSELLNPIRLPNGFWQTKKGPNYTRVSAVIIALNLFPWSIGMNDFKVYHNPNTKFPYYGKLCTLPQINIKNNAFEDIPGLDLHNILELPEKWPHCL